MKLSRRFVLAGLLTSVASTAYATSAGRLRMAKSQAPDFLVASDTDLLNLVTDRGAEGLSGKIVGVLPGDYGMTICKRLLGLAPTLACTFKGLGNPIMPGVALAGTKRFIFKNIKFYRTRANDTDPDYRFAVNVTPGSEDCWFEDCEVYSDTLATADFRGYADVSGGSGSFINQEPLISSTTGAVFGYYHAGQPNSTATRICIMGTTNSADQSGNPLGGGTAIGSSGTILRPGVTTITGQTSGASRTFVQNVSFTDFLDGFGPGTTTNPAKGLRVINCSIHDVTWPYNVNGPNMVIADNETNDCYASFGNLSGDLSGIVFERNRGINVWARDTDGMVVGTQGPHSSLLGFSQRGFNTANMIFQSCAYCVGVKRASIVGGQGYATGPKFNDQPRKIRGYIVPDGSNPGKGILTVTTTGSVLSAFTPLGAYPSNPQAASINGQRLYGQIGTSAAGVVPCVIEEQLTGTEGVAGTYRVSVSQTFASSGSPDSNLVVSATYDNLLFQNMLLVCNGGIGLEFSSMKNSTACYNTVVGDHVANVAPTTSPSLYFGDGNTNSMAHHNIFCGFTNGQRVAGYVGAPLDSEWFRKSFLNVVALPDVGSGPAHYNGLFNGNGGSFVYDASATIDDIIAMYTTKTGGRAKGKVGHDAYYNWTTEEATLPPPYTTQPRTATLNGVARPEVVFPGGTGAFSRMAKGAGNLFGVPGTSSDVMVMIMNVRFPTDAEDYNPFAASTNSINLRRFIPSSYSQIRLITKADGLVNTNLTIQTMLPVLAADGLVQIAFFIRFSTYEIYVMIGDQFDPFVAVSTFTGEGIGMGSSNFTIAAGTTTSPVGEIMSISQFLYDDTWFDPTVQSNLDKLIARDGLPPSYGSDGSTLLGHQARQYCVGNAAAWNDPAGIGTGSSPTKFIMNPGSSVVDA